MTKWSLDEIMHTGVKKREGCIRQLSSYDLLDRIRAMVFLPPPSWIDYLQLQKYICSRFHFFFSLECHRYWIEDCWQ